MKFRRQNALYNPHKIKYQVLDDFDRMRRLEASIKNLKKLKGYEKIITLQQAQLKALQKSNNIKNPKGASSSRER